MKKQFIAEAKRFQKLAGIITEMERFDITAYQEKNNFKPTSQGDKYNVQFEIFYCLNGVCGKHMFHTIDVYAMSIDEAIKKGKNELKQWETTMAFNGAANKFDDETGEPKFKIESYDLHTISNESQMDVDYENELNESNINEENLKLYYDILMDIGNTDLAGDYKEYLSKAQQYNSFDDFAKEDLSVLAQDDEDQVNDIKTNFVAAKIKKMSPKEFTSFTEKMGDYDFWSDAPNGIDPFNNIGDRMDVLSTNDDKDTNKYFDALIK